MIITIIYKLMGRQGPLITFDLLPFVFSLEVTLKRPATNKLLTFWSHLVSFTSDSFII